MSTDVLEYDFNWLTVYVVGLFHRAIAQSGSPLNYIGVVRDPLHQAKAIAVKVNCPVNNTEELVSCLREATVYDITRKAVDLQVSIQPRSVFR